MTAKCSACGCFPDKDHDCIEGQHLLHTVHWGYERLEDVGHDLGYYLRKLMKNTDIPRDYAMCIANDGLSKTRVELHKKLCTIIGADHSKFKPFESDDILHLPSESEAKKILWNAIIEHLWTYTKLYSQYKKTYKEVWGYRIKYFGNHDKLQNIF